MSGEFSHYRYLSESTDKTITLREIVEQGRAKEAAAEAERQRISTENHAKFLEGFRESIGNDGRFTEEEKAEIIKASFGWR
jgi:hypothetical protein